MALTELPHDVHSKLVVFISLVIERCAPSECSQSCLYKHVLGLINQLIRMLVPKLKTVFLTDLSGQSLSETLSAIGTDDEGRQRSALMVQSLINRPQKNIGLAMLIKKSPKLWRKIMVTNFIFIFFTFDNLPILVK